MFSSSLTSTTLIAKSTTIISSNQTVSPSTQLAAKYLDNVGYCTYYQNTTGYITELVNGGSGWTSGSQIGTQAVIGSPLAASVVENPNINLFYVAASVDELYTLSHNSSWSACIIPCHLLIRKSN